MSKANLTKASNALQRIKANPSLLEEVDLALTQFRHRVGGDLDDASFIYVLNALLNQRVVDGEDRVGEASGVTRLPAGFRILAAIKAEHHL
jgi:hypothetical protein